ncbi:hypothetical protein EV641_106203 [Rhodococcus sp. SMB37]|nr:hypothetical protein EV641_106203 [Rhodococcus sp. SMB37]
MDPDRDRDRREPHPHRLESPGHRPQPAPHRRGRHPRPGGDRPMPEPRALATNAANTNSARYARRSNNDTGNSTCVTPHERQRARRGRTRVSVPAITRGRAYSQPPSSPAPQPGQPIPPAARRDSTRTGSTSTVTIDASRITATPPRESARITGGGAAQPSVPRHTDGADDHDQPHHAPDLPHRHRARRPPPRRHPARRSTLRNHLQDTPMLWRSRSFRI